MSNYSSYLVENETLADVQRFLTDCGFENWLDEEFGEPCVAVAFPIHEATDFARIDRCKTVSMAIWLVDNYLTI